MKQTYGLSGTTSGLFMSEFIATKHYMTRGTLEQRPSYLKTLGRTQFLNQRRMFISLFFLRET